MKKILFFSLLACSLSGAQAQTESKIDWNLNKVLWSQTHHDPTKPGKPVINFDIIANWQGLGKNLTISPNGRYVAYDTYKDDPSYWSKTEKVLIQTTDGSWKRTLPPGEVGKGIGFFSSDSKQFIFEEKGGLCVIELGTDKKSGIKDFKSYKANTTVNREGATNTSCTWLAFEYENKDVLLQNLVTGKEERFSDVSSFNFTKLGGSEYLTYTTADASPEFVLYRLSDGKTQSFAAPKSQLFSNDGRMMLFNQGDSLELVSLATGNKTTVWSGTEGQTAAAPNFDSTGKKVIFTVSKANAGNSIWVWKEGSSAKQIASQSSVNAPAGFTLQSGANFAYSNEGYITFSLQKPAEKYTVPKGAVELTLWSSRDKTLQSKQMKQKDAAATRIGYLRIDDGKVVYISKQTEKADLFGDALFITQGENVSYGDQTSDRFWHQESKRCSYSLKNLKTGKSYSIATFKNGEQLTVSASPKKNYLAFFNPKTGNFSCINLKNGQIMDLCKGLNPGHFKCRDYERPGWAQASQPYTPAGWIADESGYIVYDEYDVWCLKLNSSPVNLTNGYGRKHNIAFQAEGYGWGGAPVVTEKKLLLNAFNVRTKENGFYYMTIGSKKDPEKLTMGPQMLHVTTWAWHSASVGMPPLKAEKANIWIVKRDNPEDGRNYYITHDLKSYKPITTIRAHKNVNWYTRQLHYYKCLDGTEGAGLLYLPENFNPKKKYPVIIPYYGRFACVRYVYQDPNLAWCPVAFAENPAWLVSRGYLVFVPDIKTQPITYGMACFSAIEGAAKYLNTLPYVNGKIGAMTHSWSSKLGAYQFTHSKLVKAMWLNEGYMFGNMINTAFAPTTKDHESDLGSVENWGYGELWKNKKTWLEQTTVLNLDKSQMPLMLSCGNGDLKNDTYPSQSFEIYNGLRRLNKPVWWFRYKNGGHNFFGNEEKDLTIRFTQFFDHYLKGAPAPKWMTQGIPNKLVGVETRLELDPKGSCGDPKCKVCKKRQAK